jgi:hypothetical protein
MRQLRYFCIIAFALLLPASGGAAQASCIAHQPPNMRFTAPADLPLSWSCVTAGPLYEHERRWFLITFKLSNHGAKRTEALKMEANIYDTFGDILMTVPIVEAARLGNGDSDGAVFAFHPPFTPKSVDHVTFSVLAVKWSDGTVWKTPNPPKTGTMLGADVALQRFSMRWDNYDIGSDIVPSPSPTPARSP